jgi:hypothetical protein
MGQVRMPRQAALRGLPRARHTPSGPLTLASPVSRTPVRPTLGSRIPGRRTPGSRTPGSRTPGSRTPDSRTPDRPLPGPTFPALRLRGPRSRGLNPLAPRFPAHTLRPPTRLVLTLPAPTLPAPTLPAPTLPAPMPRALTVPAPMPRIPTLPARTRLDLTCPRPVATGRPLRDLRCPARLPGHRFPAQGFPGRQFPGRQFPGRQFPAQGYLDRVPARCLPGSMRGRQSRPDRITRDRNRFTGTQPLPFPVRPVRKPPGMGRAGRPTRGSQTWVRRSRDTPTPDWPIHASSERFSRHLLAATG